MASNVLEGVSLEELRSRLADADSSVMLVEPRILGRVIKQDRRIVGLGLYVPHRHSYTLSSDRLLMIVERAELHLSPSADLPPTVILLAAPADASELSLLSADEVWHNYWRLLFHARVHVALEGLVSEGTLNEERIEARVREIGLTEFAEIHAVLLREVLLLPPRLYRVTYIEFAAVFLELSYFSPQELNWYFPCLRDWERIKRLLGEDVDHARLFHATRLRGAKTGWERLVEADETAGHAEFVIDVDPLRPSPPAYWRLLAGAERAGTVGNRVKAAILRTKATKLALPDRVAETRASARAELERLVARLQDVLHFTNAEAADWVTSLETILPRAAKGFWAPEARLLYDLQNVCIEHERGVFTLDLLEWARRWGQVPFRRPLPLLRDVLLAKHLRTALRRLNAVRLSAEQRDRLQELLELAEHRVEEQMRGHVRPRIADVLDQVGLIPRDVPERVARNKLQEELLDLIADRGFINMGDLRDALSKNNLKLQDLAGVREFFRGDPLLQADSRLARELKGVYRRGAIYQRFPQRMGSLASGTDVGRFITSYIALPYGGAYLAIEFCMYLVHLITNKPHDEVADSVSATENSAVSVEPNAADVAETAIDRPPEKAADLSSESAVLSNSDTDTTQTLAQADAGLPSAHRSEAAFSLETGLSVLLVGTFVLLLLHRPSFRHRCWDMAVFSGRLLKRLLVDWPTQIIQSPLVQQLLQSTWYRVLRSYLIKPALCSTPIVLSALASGFEVHWSDALNVLLAVSLFLNSPLGRHADEWLTDVLIRGWRELQARIVAATLRFVIDVFHQILEGLERVLYFVDEWLRFRRGEHRVLLVFKAVVGVVWAVVTYVLRFCITLFIEPQFNPIKHFPVVTVSHKLLAPWLVTIAIYLETFLSRPWAITLATAIVFVTPGIPGFLVWEFKENWRLYAANRRKKLAPTPIGTHGETVGRLLRPGFHSGTLSKLYAKLRQAARKSSETKAAIAVLKQKHKLDHCQVAIERFVERELIELLAQAPEWGGEVLRISQTRLATNRIEVDLVFGDAAVDPLTIVFEERHGWLVARLRQAGWFEQLTDSQRRVFAAALSGLYKLAGAEFVIEQVVSNFDESDVRVNIASRALEVSAPQRGDMSAHYPIAAEQQLLTPTNAIGLWPALDRRQVFFMQTDILWDEWVAFWNRDPADSPTPLWVPEEQILPDRAPPVPATMNAPVRG